MPSIGQAQFHFSPLRLLLDVTFGTHEAQPESKLTHWCDLASAEERRKVKAILYRRLMEAAQRQLIGSPARSTGRGSGAASRSAAPPVEQPFLPLCLPPPATADPSDVTPVEAIALPIKANKNFGELANAGWHAPSFRPGTTHALENVGNHRSLHRIVHEENKQST